MKFKQVINKKGFTFIELLVGLSLMSVVSAASMNLFVNMNYAYQTQEHAATIQQNSRYALDRVVNTIRMSGYGITSGTAIVSHTESTNSPDSLTIKKSLGASSAINYTSSPMLNGCTTCTIPLFNVNGFTSSAGNNKVYFTQWRIS